MSCLFCKIIAKEIPAKLIYEDEDVIAIDDIAPRAPTHKLILPRKHIATLNDLQASDAELTGKLFLVAQKIAHQLGIAEPGYRTVINCNQGAGQTIFHLHLHLLGGRPMTWPPG